MFPFPRRPADVLDVRIRRAAGFRRALLFATVLVLLGGALHLSPSSASTEAAAQPATTPGSPAVPAVPASVTAPELTFGGGHLVALVLLLGGAAFALYLRRGAHEEDNAALMQPIEAMKLAPSQQLRLVACGGDMLLLGITASGVTLLKSYPRDAFARQTASGGAATPEDAPASVEASLPRDTFAQVLRQRAVRSAMPLRSRNQPAEGTTSDASC